MNERETRVFVVDDDPSVRGALARLLRSAGWSVEAFASAEEFLARLPYSGTACVVLDVRMPDMTGPELHGRLAEKRHPLPVVFLTGHGDVPMGVQAMKNGAVDFLLKPVDDDVLLEAIHSAIERHASQRARERELRDIETRLARLSPREREVMEHVFRGRRNKQIAADLGIAEKTVKAHRGQVMQKMEVRSVAELVRILERL